MQLFFIKNIPFFRFNNSSHIKKVASRLPSPSHIHHLPHHNLLYTSHNIIHPPHPQHLILRFQLLRHTLFLLHLLHKLIQHLMAFLINLMQIFIQLPTEQKLHIIPNRDILQSKEGGTLCN